MNKIIITVEGGLIQDIANIPVGTTVEVRDYDVDTNDGCLIDENGDEYLKSEWQESCIVTEPANAAEKYTVHLGCTLQAYAKVEVEAANEIELREKVQALLEDAGNQDFKVSGEADDYRIIDVLDEDRQCGLDERIIHEINEPFGS